MKIGNLILAWVNFIALTIPASAREPRWTAFAINVLLLVVGLHYFTRYMKSALSEDGQ